MARKKETREELAVRLLTVGAASVILPLALAGTAFGKGFVAAIPLGFIMLLAGSGLLWFSRKQPGVITAAEKVSRAKPDSWGPGVFEVIEWRRFEAVIEALFQQAGFKTSAQTHGPDGGVDVWLYSPTQPDQAVCLVQCKHWQGKQVGVDKVRELRGVMAARNVARGMLATTSTFSSEAAAFAKENGIDLLDADKLLTNISKRTPAQQQALLAVALEGDYSVPTCASCGVKMVERTPRKGGKTFWGCRNFPRCKSTLPMRAANG